MRKLLLALLLLTTPAYADVISLHDISSDSNTTVYDENFDELETWANGNVEGSADGGSTVANLKADSVFEINMANDANPRLRDAELLGIGTDSLSGSTLDQDSFVSSGCVPADDTDLTSDISACVAYVNGYRVSKSATSTTYTASRDCYVDLSQSGVYTVTCVTNGASAPSVASNSSRLSKVVTNGTEITTITDLANRRLPGLVTPSNYRDGFIVSKDSTTTITVGPGTAEINSVMVTKTSPTTLTISTAGDWAGGSSLRAADTYAYVGIDDDGNLKMHTTAPTHSNYGVSNTDGKKRYATWSSTVYRTLGWLYMDGAASPLVDVASNISEGGVRNFVQSHDANLLSSFSSTTFSDLQRVPFYNSGGSILLTSNVSADSSGAMDGLFLRCQRAGSTISGCGGSGGGPGGAGGGMGTVVPFIDVNRPQGTTTYSIQGRVTGSSVNAQSRVLILEEL